MVYFLFFSSLVCVEIVAMCQNGFEPTGRFREASLPPSKHSVISNCGKSVVLKMHPYEAGVRRAVGKHCA